MASTTPHHDRSTFAPFTPLNKNVTSTPTPTSASTQLRDSPFSDYFSDSTPPSSPEKQQLLTRMKQLQVLLMQGEQEAERETLNIVERKIGEIETQLNTMHSQTRMPPELEDSGLFMEDDEDEEEMVGEENVEDAFFEPPTPITVLLDAPLASEMVEADVEEQTQVQVEHDTLLAESQRVLASVSKAQEQLRQRCKELRALNTLQLTTVDELRTENAELRSQLEANSSDLHFLHHKFRKLEIEVRALDAGAQRLETYAPEIREDIQRVKRMRMEEEMERWEQEWRTVEGNTSARRKSEVERGRKEKSMGESYVPVKLEEDEEVKGLGLQAVEKTADDGRVNEVVAKRVAKDQWRAPKIVGSYPRDSSSNSSEEALPQQPEAQPEAKDFDQRAMTATTATSSSSFDKNLVLTATGSPVSQSLFDRADYDTDEDDDEEREAKLKLDCAITTSSEDNSVPFYSNRSKKAEKRNEGGDGKSAWRELVEGLAGLAGMGEW